jgi:hypothetical protein
VRALRLCVAQRDDVDVDLVELLQPHAARRAPAASPATARSWHSAGSSNASSSTGSKKTSALASTSRTGKCCSSLSVSEAASGHALAVDEARLVARLLVKGADSDTPGALTSREAWKSHSFFFFFCLTRVTRDA